MKKIFTMLMLTLLVPFLVRVANTRTIRVPSDFPSIQEGIDNANDDDTVLVSSGTYVERIDFKGKGILLTSVAGAESTVIDGDSAGTVVSFISGEDTTSVIQGFTITNGLVIWGGGGAGILCQASSPRVLDNRVISNTVNGYYGAGVACIEGSKALIFHNIIAHNSVHSIFSRGAVMGAGIYCCKSSPIIISNVVADNALFAYDGEVLPTGAGIAVIDSSCPEIQNNLIVRNEATYQDNGAGGGIGCLLLAGSLSIINNTIVGNKVGSNLGGGISLALCNECHIEITNNILAENSKGIYCYDATPLILYNDFWVNEGGNFTGCPAGIGDTTWGLNCNGIPCDSFFNIFRDPAFAIDPEGEYYLSQIAAGQVEQSPCVDAGSASAESLGLGCYTTRTDSVPDSEVVDMGFHYRAKTYDFVQDIPHFLVPRGFRLSQNYPNPFNSTTLIRYQLPAIRDQQSAVSLKIYNVLGQKVRTLVNKRQTPGYYSVSWDARDDLGKEISSGIYFYRLKAGDFVEIKKTILLK